MIGGGGGVDPSPPLRRHPSPDEERGEYGGERVVKVVGSGLRLVAPGLKPRAGGALRRTGEVRLRGLG